MQLEEAVKRPHRCNRTLGNLQPSGSSPGPSLATWLTKPTRLSLDAATSRLGEQQEATITYLSVWLGDGQPVTFYAPPSSGCPRRFNDTLGECTSLPWVVDCFYIRGLDRDLHKKSSHP